MNLRAPYSAPPPRRKSREPDRGPHFRHENTYPKIPGNYRSSGAGGAVVADGNDRSANALARELRVVASDLLCRGRPWLGAACNAHRQLDGKTRPLIRPALPAWNNSRQDHAHRAQRSAPAVPTDAWQ